MSNEPIKIFKVINKSNDNIEYTFSIIDTDKGTLYRLSRSKDSGWSYGVRGEEVACVLDSGDKIRLDDSFGIELDYANFAELSLLFDLIRMNDSNLMDEYQVVSCDDMKDVKPLTK
jgi:hypothetical protein